MRRLLLLMYTLIIGVHSLFAQDREALEDSVIIGGIPRPMLDMVLDDMQMTHEEKLMGHWTFSEMMKNISREHLASFNDQELRQILEFYNTHAYRYLNSSTFLTTYVGNITKALQSEVGAAPEFSYLLNDKDYASGFEPFFKASLAAYDHIIDEMLDEDGAMISKARQSGIPDTQIRLMISALRKVLDNLFNIFKLSVVDYLSAADLKEYEAFMNSSTGQKFAVYSQNVISITDVSMEKFVADFSARLERKEFILSDIKSSVAEYVSLSRAFPLCLPELYRPYAEVMTREGLYEGQTRDRLPHGKGRLTDRKGVVYEGDFRNGVRHGLITVTKPGKEAVLQFWISDKYRKDVPLAADQNGVLPKAYVLDGQRYGYGTAYNQETKSRLQGIFIDGQLNGRGKVYETGMTVDGEFVDGIFVHGTITCDTPSGKVSVFRGRMSGDLGNGVFEWTAPGKLEKEVQQGTFVDGLQEGEGTRVIMFKDGRISSSGTYAYGRQYGRGVFREKVKDKQGGIERSSVYEGGFYADSFHGEGTLHMTLKNIPGGSWNYECCNVKLPSFTADSLEIILNGFFEDGSFRNGKVTYSDGSWYEGQFDENGLTEGTMRRIYSDGSCYQGGCRLGKCHGNGEIHYADGTVYKGEFDNGSPVKKDMKPLPEKKSVNVSEMRYDEQIFKFRNLSVGKGKAALIKPAGVKIMVRTVQDLDVTCEGSFEGDILVKGKVTMTDGNWLEGVFEDGVLIRGCGKTVDKYGTIYEGEIKNGYPHGKGKCIYTNKTWFKGNFANGNRMDGTHYAADGKVIKVYE